MKDLKYVTAYRLVKDGSLQKFPARLLTKTPGFILGLSGGRWGCWDAATGLLIAEGFRTMTAAKVAMEHPAFIDRIVNVRGRIPKDDMALKVLNVEEMINRDHNTVLHDFLLQTNKHYSKYIL